MTTGQITPAPLKHEVDWSTVAIVGVGLIGGSLALGLRRSGLTRRVIGVSSPATVEQALQMRVIDDGGGYAQLTKLIADAGVVFLCTPIHSILDLIPQALESARAGSVITDVGSTKGLIVQRAREHACAGVTFIGGHPMAGSEESGINAADPFLFQNAMYALTPDPSVDSGIVRSFGDGLAKLGARVIQLDPQVHDRVAAAVSHLPQLISLALVELAGARNAEDAAHLMMAAGGFRDMTRIASSPFGMWRDILTTNDAEIRRALNEFRQCLDAIENDLCDTEAHFESANRTRAMIPRDAKGFLSPLHDVLVRVEDRPGVLAHITSALSGAGINIKDIDLLKVREGEGGTFRMGFADGETAERAISQLQEAGFEARLR